MMRRMNVLSSASYLGIAKHVRESKSVFLVGAGISTSAGVPDFRSPAGVFERIRKEHNLTGEDLFTASVINGNPAYKGLYIEVICRMKEVLAGATPSPTHQVLEKIHRAYNTRIYTQNIDGLEERTGIGAGKHRRKIVYLHGNLNFLVCSKCHHRTAYTPEANRELSAAKRKACPACARREAEQREMGRRPTPKGTLLPDVVLYGGYNPGALEIAKKMGADKDLSLFVAMGTSIRVHGVKHMSRELSRSARANGGLSVYVGREEPPKRMVAHFDMWFQGDCDTFSVELLGVIKGRAILRDIRRLSMEDRGAAPASRLPSIMDVLASGVKRMSIEPPCEERARAGDKEL